MEIGYLTVKRVQMKYIAFYLIFALLSAWYWLQFDTPRPDQKIKIHGKTYGLKGELTLKIEEKYLNLNRLDRFTFIVYVATLDKLNMEISHQPDHQHCELLVSNTEENTIHLKILCKSAIKLTQ